MRNSPFRQGGHGDAETDCHGQFENWPRNDREVYMGCGTRPGGSSRRPTPTHHSPIELRRGRRPRRPCSLIYIGSPHPFSPHFLFNVCGFSVENAPVPYFSPFPVEIAHFPCGQKI